MRNAERLFLVLVALLMSSCGNGLLREMSRSTGDPAVVAPSVSPFIKENVVAVSWPQDANADQYILEKALDSATPSYTAVYAGSNTSYEDTNCTDQGRYLYRLTRTRGTKSFGPSETVMGVASAVSRDALEPNDLEGQATPLTATLAANLYCYTSTMQQNGAPLVTQDVDWYSVIVPPHRTANIVVTQDNLLGGSTNTWMYFCLKATNPQQIVNNQAIPVTNTSDVAVEMFLFKIYPIPSSFAAGSGGSLITYTVSLYSITSY
jgi:hypothetical protein